MLLDGGREKALFVTIKASLSLSLSLLDPPPPPSPLKAPASTTKSASHPSDEPYAESAL